jgi:hypothetical protein
MSNNKILFFRSNRIFSWYFRDESSLPIIDEYADELWVEKFAPRAFCDLLSDIVS